MGSHPVHISSFHFNVTTDYVSSRGERASLPGRPGVWGATQDPFRGKCGPMLGDVSAQGASPRYHQAELQKNTDRAGE